jgi:predicted dehydrogenase/threonine dehydrogenase-like Zn-dependent dehydrogenase
MKQLLQRLDNGHTLVREIPVPSPGADQLLVETRSTVISAGTERMLREFGRSNLIEKARSQPDKLRQVLDKVRTDGLAPTLEAVRAKLDTPIPLGYCHAGVVVEVGPGVTAFRAGNRVVTNGPHAEYVSVPAMLAARIPDPVSFESASFTPLAAIGLQGIRLAAPTLGETVVVYGLGLIGLLTLQLLRAGGCRVIGIDRSPARLSLAQRFGAEVIDGSTADAAASVLQRTRGIGADAVLLTLASSGDEPIRQAATMSRKRGRLILVGATGLRLNRDHFYKKELSFQVSCSYGPGRYDPVYEEQAQDYPLAYVRWTEQRNFEAVLGLMEQGTVDPTPLITHRFAFEEVPKAYDVIAGSEPNLGVVLTYSDRGGRTPTADDRVVHRAPEIRAAPSRGTAGVIGAGSFATRTLLPALKAARVHLRTIASRGGTSAAIAAEKFGFETVTTDLDAIFADQAVDCVYLLTRHESHAGLVLRGLQAGKHVFVEKPLALNLEELGTIEAAVASSGRLLTVGFNRRFAPLAEEARGLLYGRAGPVALVLTVNAGSLPQDHWTQHLEEGGRVLGEACHFIDLARSLVGVPIRSLDVTTARDSSGAPIDDVATLLLQFEDGSTAAVHYLANGSGTFPKERVEAFFDGKTLVIDNWRRLRRYGMPGSWFRRARRIDKGHEREIRAWVQATRDGGPAPIPLDELYEVSRWSIHAAELARNSARG